MKSMNRVFLMGRLGADPQLMKGKNGRPFTRLSLATHRYRVDGNGQRHELVDWHSVFVWGHQAEICNEHLRKGALVFVEGYLNYWHESEAKLTKSAIQADQVHFMNANPSAHLDNPDTPLNHNAVAHPA